MRKLVIIVITMGLFASTSGVVFAKRTLPNITPKAAGSVSNTTSNASRLGIKAKFRGDRRAIVVTFTNLSIASSVNYTLTYDNFNKVTQAAGGSVAKGIAEPVSRELLFGTCSSGVCRYDSGISNAKLVVNYTLKNGKKIVKTFKIRV
jgi:hypothetical protein